MKLFQRAKEENRKRKLTSLLSMQVVGRQVTPVSNLPNQPATKKQEHLKAIGNPNPQRGKLPKSTLVQWLEFTAAYVNPATYIVFTVNFFAVSITLM